MNKSWRQHPTKQQLYGHLLPITTTSIKVSRTRHMEHCWRSKDELISDVLLWTLSHGRAKARWPARNYIQQLCVDTGCSPEDLPEAMNDREGWRERIGDIRADGTTRWWWWWWYIYLYISIYIYIYIFIYIQDSQHTHTHTHTDICIYVCVNVSTCVCLLSWLLRYIRSINNTENALFMNIANDIS